MTAQTTEVDRTGTGKPGPLSRRQVRIVFGGLLVVTTVVLRIPFRRLRRRIDYLGSLLLVAAVSCVVTATTWGGTTFPWRSCRTVDLRCSQARTPYP